MEYLNKLFGSPARVKLLRLFLFNPESVYDRDEVVKMARITPDTASKELSALGRASLITRKTFSKEVVRPGSKTAKKRKAIGWVLNKKYEHLEPLTVFMRDTLSVSGTDIGKRFQGAGSIRLLVLSGFLTGVKEGELDLLLVGERLNEAVIDNAIQSLEAECGQEIRYMMLKTEDYHFRRRVRDKFVRDVIDFPHKEIINKIGKL
jgi:hypothetical protein